MGWHNEYDVLLTRISVIPYAPCGAYMYIRKARVRWTRYLWVLKYRQNIMEKNQYCFFVYRTLQSIEKTWIVTNKTRRMMLAIVSIINEKQLEQLFFKHALYIPFLTLLQKITHRIFTHTE
jgi:hypothetical protein